MNRLLPIIGVFIMVACNSADAPDCFKTSGGMVSRPIKLARFGSLHLQDEFQVILSEGDSQQVILFSGENIIDDISLEVNDSVLEVSNKIRCRWARDYSFPILEITHPGLSFMEIPGGSIVNSRGVLHYPAITLLSENSNSIINLNIDSRDLVIISNDLTNYRLAGRVDNLGVYFYAGNGRLDGADLVAKRTLITHTGTNEVIVHTTELLQGSVNATGDLIFTGQRPGLIDVELTNRGKLIDRTN